MFVCLQRARSERCLSQVRRTDISVASNTFGYHVFLIFTITNNPGYVTYVTLRHGFGTYFPKIPISFLMLNNPEDLSRFLGNSLLSALLQVFGLFD